LTLTGVAGYLLSLLCGNAARGLLPRVLQQFMTTLARPAATTPHDTSVDLR